MIRCDCENCLQKPVHLRGWKPGHETEEEAKVALAALSARIGIGHRVVAADPKIDSQHRRLRVTGMRVVQDADEIWKVQVDFWPIDHNCRTMQRWVDGVADFNAKYPPYSLEFFLKGGIKCDPNDPSKPTEACVGELCIPYPVPRKRCGKRLTNRDLIGLKEADREQELRRLREEAKADAHMVTPAI